MSNKWQDRAKEYQDVEDTSKKPSKISDLLDGSDLAADDHAKASSWLMDDDMPAEAETVKNDPAAQVQYEALLGEMKDAEKRVKEYWDKMMRMQADIQNIQRRAEKDVADAHKYALGKFVDALIPVLDSLEQALEVKTSDNPEIISLRTGIELTLKMFADVLGKFDVTVINPMGERFNAELHEAMSMVDVPNAEPNTVVIVLQKGYLLNNRLIRPARVMIAKPK